MEAKQQEQEQDQQTETTQTATAVPQTQAPTEASAPAEQVQAAVPKMSLLETIKVRSSIRNYSRVPNAEEAEYIQECIRNLPKSGPFADTEARFVYVPVELGFTSSYGVIAGPHHNICGAVTCSPHDFETYGYLFERLQLECYRIGLGTVWLGGTFAAGPFAPYVGIKDPKAEIMPAVAPVGLSTGSVGFVASIFKWSAGSKTRKEWSEMFFDGKYGTPITQEAAGKYSECLEAVRK